MSEGIIVWDIPISFRKNAVSTYALTIIIRSSSS
jgi:hypothetical protein